MLVSASYDVMSNVSIANVDRLMMCWLVLHIKCNIECIHIHDDCGSSHDVLVSASFDVECIHGHCGLSHDVLVSASYNMTSNVSMATVDCLMMCWLVPHIM